MIEATFTTKGGKFSMECLPYEAPVNQRGLSEDSLLLEIIKRFHFQEIDFLFVEIDVSFSRDWEPEILSTRDWESKSLNLKIRTNTFTFWEIIERFDLQEIGNQKEETNTLTFWDCIVKNPIWLFCLNFQPTLKARDINTYIWYDDTTGTSNKSMNHGKVI